MKRFLASRGAWSIGLVLPVALAACARTPADPAPPTTATPTVAPAAPVSPAVAIARVGDARSSSGVALGVADGKTLAFVADEDGLAVRVVDAATMKETSSLALTGRPGQLLVAKTGQLWVALRDEASVAVLDLHQDGSLTRAKTIGTAAEPLALASVDADGAPAAVLVVSGWGHTLERFAAVDFARGHAVDLPREPRAVLASHDGTKAFVSHAASGGVTVVPLGGEAAATTIDLGEAPSGGFTSDIAPIPHPSRPPPVLKAAPINAFMTDADPLFPDDVVGFEMIPARFARQGFALVTYQTSSGESVLAPHAEMMTGDPKIVSSGYGGGGVEADLPTEEFRVSTLAVSTSKRVAISRPDRHPCRLPRAAALADRTLFVACLGGNEIVAVDAADPSTTFARVAVAAGPTAIATDPTTKNVYVLSSFDGALTRLSFDRFAPPVKAKKKAPAASASASASPPVPETTEATLRFARPSPFGELAERGRRIFHSGGDVQISRDGRSCASCHPDGRDDGLVWSTPNGPRQTITLAGRIQHAAPFGWMGKHATLQEHMRSTMKNLKGKGLAPADEDALASYLTAMKGPPTATPAHVLTPEEANGRAVFASSAGCGGCHGGADKSDHEIHDVQSKTASERSGDLLAPSLVGIAGSAPYFHDGRYASLEELVEKSDGKMGTTGALSPTDRTALVAYLRTL